VQGRTGQQADKPAEQVDAPALTRQTSCSDLPVDQAVAIRRPEHDLAALGGYAAGLDQAAVLELPGEDAHRVALQRAQVDGLVTGRLQLQVNAFEAPARYFHLLARGQDGGAVGRLDQRTRSDLHVRR